MPGILPDNPDATPPEVPKGNTLIGRGLLPWHLFRPRSADPPAASYLEAGALPKVRTHRVRGGILGLREPKSRKPLKGHPRPRTWAEKARQFLPVDGWRKLAGKDRKYLPVDPQSDNWFAYRVAAEAERERNAAAQQAFGRIPFDANRYPIYSRPTWWRYCHRGFWSVWAKMGRPRKANKLSNAAKQKAYRERKKARLGKE